MCYWPCQSFVLCPNTSRFLLKLILNFYQGTEGRVRTIYNENEFHSKTLGLNLILLRTVIGNAERHKGAQPLPWYYFLVKL
jgi:hypothetical protein